MVPKIPVSVSIYFSYVKTIPSWHMIHITCSFCSCFVALCVWSVAFLLLFWCSSAWKTSIFLGGWVQQLMLQSLPKSSDLKGLQTGNLRQENVRLSEIPLHLHRMVLMGSILSTGWPVDRFQSTGSPSWKHWFSAMFPHHFGLEMQGNAKDFCFGSKDISKLWCYMLIYAQCLHGYLITLEYFITDRITMVCLGLVLTGSFKHLNSLY